MANDETDRQTIYSAPGRGADEAIATEATIVSSQVLSPLKHMREVAGTKPTKSRQETFKPIRRTVVLDVFAKDDTMDESVDT